MRGAAQGLALLCALTLATGCEVSFFAGSKQYMSKETLETKLRTSIAEKTGSSIGQVECPDDLEGTVGAVMTCTLAHQGRTVEVAVNVTSVDGEDIKFDYETRDPAAK